MQNDSHLNHLSIVTDCFYISKCADLRSSCLFYILQLGLCPPSDSGIVI